MPPIRSEKARKSIEQESRIQLAIQAIKNQEISSIREVARRFNVSRTSLSRRLNGTTFRGETRANRYKLTQTEEETLLQWILSMDSRGAAPQLPMVEEMANILLAERCHDRVGKNWVYKFVKRQDQLKTRFSRRYSYQRAKREDPEIIREWFLHVQGIIAKYGILHDDIYNFDETGFAMGQTSSSKVVTRREYYGWREVIEPENREWVTSIETINTMGWVLPPCVIFKAKVHQRAWYEDQDLPGDWRIKTSDNGWITD